MDLAPYLYVLEDPDASLSIDEARRRFHADTFKPAAGGSFNKGYTGSSWWIAF